MTRKYILKRLILAAFLILCLSFVIYLLVWYMPGDYVTSRLIGNTKVNEEIKLRMIQLYGLDKGLFSGFGTWILSAVKGDWGTSFLYQKPVMGVLTEKLRVTVPFCLAVLVFQLLLSLFFGVFAAVKKGKFFDRLVSVLCMAGSAVPVFLMAILLQKWLAFDAGILPVSGMRSVRENAQGFYQVLDVGKHMVLPVTVLVLSGLPSYIKLIRSEMCRVLSSGYVLAARARGMKEHTIVMQHALPNIWPSLLSFVGRFIPALITGTLIVEQIFAIDGIGQTAFAAFSYTDIPLIMGFCVVMSVVTLLITLFEDILCAYLNPHMRFYEGERA